MGPAAEAKIIILIPHHRHVEEKNNAKVGAVCISLWNGLLLVSGRGVEWFTGGEHRLVLVCYKLVLMWYWCGIANTIGVVHCRFWCYGGMYWWLLLLRQLEVALFEMLPAVHHLHLHLHLHEKKMTVRGTMVRSEVCNSWCFCLES